MAGEPGIAHNHSMEEMQELLTLWQNRTSQKWGGEKLAEMNHEIDILQALQTYGCLRTNDGLFVKNQLENRRQTIRDIQKQDGEI
jgi:hypothetical protein